MKGLLLFHFRYRWPYLLLYSLLGGIFIFLYCAQPDGRVLLMLCLAFVYAQLPDRFGIRKGEDEFVPNLALPFSKAEYILYTAVRTLVYYAVCAVFAGGGLGIGYLLNPRLSAAFTLIPFVIVFFALLHAVTLVLDCFSGFRFGRGIVLPLMIVSLVQGEPLGSALAHIDPTGILAAAQHSFAVFVFDLAKFPGTAIIAALALAGASVLFAVFRARKIRF